MSSTGSWLASSNHWASGSRHKQQSWSRLAFSARIFPTNPARAASQGRKERREVKIAAVSENLLFFFGPAKGGNLEGESRSPREDDDEKALRERCGSGDVSAFEELYRTHGARMKSLAAN